MRAVNVCDAIHHALIDLGHGRITALIADSVGANTNDIY